MRAVTLIGLAVVLVSCEQRPSSPEPKPAAQQRSEPASGYQRFVPLPRQPENLRGVPWSGAFALDTQTGQLCRTYQGDLAEPWRSLPLCVDLSKGNGMHPASTGPQPKNAEEYLKSIGVK